MTVATMPRKKRTGAGRPKGPTPPRETIASFKGSAAFAKWLEAFVRHCRMPASSVIENALIEYARFRGFDQEAPER